MKVSTDAGIVGWGEMLKDDAKACAAGALEVGDCLVGQAPCRVVFHWQAIHRGAFYRGGPTRDRISVYGTVSEKTGVSATKTGSRAAGRGAIKYVEGQK